MYLPKKRQINFQEDRDPSLFTEIKNFTQLIVQPVQVKQRTLLGVRLKFFV